MADIPPESVQRAQNHSWGASDDSARVTALEWAKHVEMVGRIRERLDLHDDQIREYVTATVEGVMIRMTPLVEEACERALRSVAKDTDWWRANVKQIATHAKEMSSAWVGKRIMLYLGGIIAAGILVWLVQTGQLPKK